jgi:hypothetical protein
MSITDEQEMHIGGHRYGLVGDFYQEIVVFLFVEAPDVTYHEGGIWDAQGLSEMGIGALREWFEINAIIEERPSFVILPSRPEHGLGGANAGSETAVGQPAKALKRRGDIEAVGGSSSFQEGPHIVMTVNDGGGNAEWLGEEGCEQSIGVTAVDMKDVVRSIFINDASQVGGVFDRVPVIEAGQNVSASFSEGAGKGLFLVGADKNVVFKAMQTFYDLVQPHLYSAPE